MLNTFLKNIKDFFISKYFLIGFFSGLFFIPLLILIWLVGFGLELTFGDGYFVS